MLGLVRGVHSEERGTDPVMKASIEICAVKIWTVWVWSPVETSPHFIATALTKLTIPYRHTWQSALYAEDTFRISKSLTLNFGLRWEAPMPPHDKYDNIASFVAANDSFAPNTPFMIARPNQNGFSRKILQVHYNDFSPRFGFAWRPFDSNKWSVRGSYGLFYETLIFDEYSFQHLGVPIVIPVQEQSRPDIPTVSIAGQFANSAVAGSPVRFIASGNTSRAFTPRGLSRSLRPGCVEYHFVFSRSAFRNASSQSDLLAARNRLLTGFRSRSSRESFTISRLATPHITHCRWI